MGSALNNQLCSPVAVVYTNETGNRLASWTATNAYIRTGLDVSGYSSETIGTNDLFGALWVKAGGDEVEPEVSGSNFTAAVEAEGFGSVPVRER